MSATRLALLALAAVIVLLAVGAPWWAILMFVAVCWLAAA